MRRMNLFDIFLSQENLTTALEHDTYSFTWVGKSFTSQLTKITFSRVMGVDFESFITKPSVVSLCVQEVWNKTFNRKIPNIHCVIIESVLAATFLQLELWFRVAGLPATGRFLSTSAHYLESWLRNRQYLGVCMHQWQVSRLQRQFSSLTCDRRIPRNVRHRLIHSHLMDCAGYFENHWHYWWSLSRLLTVYIIDW